MVAQILLTDKNHLKELLENIYKLYHSRDWIGSDPVAFLYDYNNLLDREIVALIAALMAYGQVGHIKKKVRFILDILGSSPYESLLKRSYLSERECLLKFKHRFTTGYQILCLLDGISAVLNRYGSIGNCFRNCWRNSGCDILSSVSCFRSNIGYALDNWGMFLPDPNKKGACKRWFLFLRWMVRKDKIDPGGWDFIKPSYLLVPLDVHMHRVALELGFTTRKSGDIKTVLEITKALSFFDPEDPVRYDFSLTRWSMEGFKGYEGYRIS